MSADPTPEELADLDEQVADFTSRQLAVPEGERQMLHGDKFSSPIGEPAGQPELTVTQELIMELLAARDRLGGLWWPRQKRLRDGRNGSLRSQAKVGVAS